MKTVTNAYILNLALADECFLIGIPFLIVTMIYGNNNDNNSLESFEEFIVTYFQASGFLGTSFVNFT